MVQNQPIEEIYECLEQETEEGSHIEMNHQQLATIDSNSEKGLSVQGAGDDDAS